MWAEIGVRSEMRAELENMNEQILLVDEKISKLIDKLERIYGDESKDELRSIIEDALLDLEEIRNEVLN